MRGETFTENKKQGQNYEVVCEHCQGSVTEHAVMQSVEVRSTEELYDPEEGQKVAEIAYYNDFQIIRCNGCKWISFRQASSDSESYRAEEDAAEVEHEELFPARMKGRKKLEGYQKHLPPTVRDIYEETHFALTNDQRILAGVGFRALMEAVCAEKGAGKKKDSLEERIDKLVELHITTKESAEVLHGTRLLGNDAAHEVRPPTDRELLAAIQVIENLLQTVFVIPKLKASLPKPKPKAVAAAPAPPAPPKTTPQKES